MVTFLDWFRWFSDVLTGTFVFLSERVDLAGKTSSTKRKQNQDFLKGTTNGSPCAGVYKIRDQIRSLQRSLTFQPVDGFLQFGNRPLGEFSSSLGLKTQKVSQQVSQQVTRTAVLLRAEQTHLL